LEKPTSAGHESQPKRSKKSKHEVRTHNRAPAGLPQQPTVMSRDERYAGTTTTTATTGISINNININVFDNRALARDLMQPSSSSSSSSSSNDYLSSPTSSTSSSCSSYAYKYSPKTMDYYELNNPASGGYYSGYGYYPMTTTNINRMTSSYVDSRFFANGYANVCGFNDYINWKRRRRPPPPPPLTNSFHYIPNFSLFQSSFIFIFFIYINYQLQFRVLSLKLWIKLFIYKNYEKSFLF
jgi:hypothetical protein